MKNTWKTKEAYKDYLEDRLIDKLYEINPADSTNSLTLIKPLYEVVSKYKTDGEAQGYYHEDEISQLIQETIRAYFAAKNI